MLHVRHLEAYFGHQCFEPLVKVSYCFCQRLLNLLGLNYTLGLRLWLSEFRDHCASNLLEIPLRLLEWYYTVLHIPIQRMTPQSCSHLHFLDVIIVNEADCPYCLVEEPVLFWILCSIPIECG